MNRLTTNKDTSEMSMYELAHNACYSKDGLARYRDFEMDMDARDFARNLMSTLTDDDLPTDDDAFDDEIMENLMYDPFESVTGLIALFYRNLWAMADLRETLKVYEDAAERGGWILCSERLPENPHVTEYEEYPEYIVMIEGEKKPTTLQYAGDGKWFEQSDDSWYKVTAWQPLPASYQPKGE